MEETITYHTCSKCGEDKPLTIEYFYKNKSLKLGFNYSCKECSLEYSKEYRENNKEKIIKRKQKYRENNKEKIRISGKLYRKKNRNEIYKKKKIYTSNRRKNNYIYRLSEIVRVNIVNNIKNKGWSKNTRTHNYLKCDWETFKEHIESQFTEGMSWDNQGEWHLDHYYPISLAQTEEDMYIFNHYTNFQPLWSKDNLEKSDKVPDGFEEWYESMKEKVSQ